LGVFKAECGTFFQASQYVSSLKKRDTYAKKGERRQKSMVFHQTFLLSLKLGFFTYELSASEFVFWLEEREKFLKPE
jgi:hypothetical protein